MRAPDDHRVGQICGNGGKAQGKLYAFQENFKWTGQRFSMVDMEGNVLYGIEGTWPLRTLNIYPHDSEQPVFRVKKGILHL